MGQLQLVLLLVVINIIHSKPIFIIKFTCIILFSVNTTFVWLMGEKHYNTYLHTNI